MYTLFNLILVTICSQYAFGKGLTEMGPVNAVDFQSFGTCSFKNTLKTTLKLTFNKDPKSLSGEFSMPFEFGEPIKYQMILHKYMANGSLKKNVFKTDGPACEHLNKFVKPTFKNFLAALDPKVTSTCVIKKGSYKFKKVRASISDINVPSFPYGKFKAEIRLMQGKDNVAFCVEVVAEVS